MSVLDKRIILEKNGDPTVWPTGPLKGQLKWPDGALVVLTPVALMREAETESAYFTRIVAGDNTAYATQIAVVDKTELPFADPADESVIEDYFFDEATEDVLLLSVFDRVKAYRKAWRWNGSAVVVDATIEDAERWTRARAIRNKLLELSDGPMDREREQSGLKQASYEKYRLDLRNLPADNPDPKSINWPAKP